MPKRPAPVDVGEIRGRAVRSRGPRGPEDGRWYWRAEVNAEGRRRMVWRGWATRTELPLVLAQVLVAGTDARPAPIADILCVADLMDAWFTHAIAGQCRAEGTEVSIRGSTRRISSGIGTCRLDRLSRLALDQWVGGRRRRGNAPGTIRYDLGTLRRAWSWGRQVGACPRGDLATPRIAPGTTRTKRTPTLGEVAAVVARLEISGPPWAAVAIRLQAALGCRIGELAHLTWRHVDLDLGVATLHGKTGARRVPLRAEVLDVLRSLDASTTWVLGRAPGTVRQMNRIIRQACAEVDVVPFSTHGLRRLAVDTLARAGVDVGTAAALLGHTPQVMLEAYRQVGLDEQREAVAALGRLPRGDVIDLDARRRTDR